MVLKTRHIKQYFLSYSYLQSNAISLQSVCFPKAQYMFFYLPWLHIAQKCVLFRNAEVQGREKWTLMIFQPIGHPDLLIIRRQLSIQAFNVEVRYDRSRIPCFHYRPSHCNWLCQLNQEYVQKLMEQ